MDVMTGLLLETAYAAAPGPIIVETVRHGLHGGLRVAASLLSAFLAAFWQARLSGGATRTLSRASGLVLIGFGLHLGAVTANLMS